MVRTPGQSANRPGRVNEASIPRREKNRASKNRAMLWPVTRSIRSAATSNPKFEYSNREPGGNDGAGRLRATTSSILAVVRTSSGAKYGSQNS